MRTSKKLVLGIDGGGTKTEWIALEHYEGEAAVLGQGRLPASNLKLTDDAALLRLFRVLPKDATHVGAFLAGCSTDPDRQRLRALVGEVWPAAAIEVGSDRQSAFATAFRDRNGIAVICGTGSAVHGRIEGHLERAGGWGQLLGDHGGGYDLAMQGLRQTLRAFDLDHHVTSLGRDILLELALNGLDDLVDWAKTADKMSVAKLAPILFKAAREGDSEVIDLINAGARRLAQYAAAVAGRLGMESPQVKLLGGLFVHHAEYADLFTRYLHDLLPEADIEVCAASPAVGAAWLAANGELRVDAAQSLDELELSTYDSEQIADAITEQPNPRSEHLDELNTSRLIDLFVTEEARVTEALAASRDSLERAVNLTSEALAHGGRLFYVGAGTSGRLGVLDASEIPPTFGAPADLVQGIIAGGAPALHRAVEGAEDESFKGRIAIQERGAHSGDVVCGITASGRTPFVLGALAQAREAGAATILLTCNPARHRGDTQWDVEIDLPTGPELVTGSTRLKAGTATKLALNILSTGAMIRLGKVKGNLMVDLKATNTKLRDRAIRTVSRTRRISYAEARDLLGKHAWNVRKSLES